MLSSTRFCDSHGVVRPCLVRLGMARHRKAWRGQARFGKATNIRRREMSLLPTMKQKPRYDLSSYTILLYGVEKIGKSEFASQFPDVLMMATEAGLTAIECYQVAIDAWPTFLAACSELVENPGRFKSVCIDTLDNLWLYCRNYIIEKHKVEHESDLSYGKGYGLIQSEFQRVLTKLSHMDFGLLMTSHCTVQEITTRVGSTHRFVPTLPQKARKLVIGMSDLILFADTEADQDKDGKQCLRRVLRTKPNPNYDAGDRTGRLPDPIPLDFQVFRQEFERAVSAFRNKPAANHDNGKSADSSTAAQSRKKG